MAIVETDCNPANCTCCHSPALEHDEIIQLAAFVVEVAENTMVAIDLPLLERTALVVVVQMGVVVGTSCLCRESKGNPSSS